MKQRLPVAEILVNFQVPERTEQIHFEFETTANNNLAQYSVYFIDCLIEVEFSHFSSFALKFHVCSLVRF